MHIHKIKHHWTHYLGLASSSLCLVHCVAMPLLIPLFPAFSAVADTHDWRLEAFFIAFIALTTITIVNGYRLHRSTRTLWFASAGFALLVSSLFLEHTFAQILISVFGSAFMLMAHFANYKLCSRQTCCPH